MKALPADRRRTALVARAPDERLRRALQRLDSAARHQVADVAAEAADVAAAVVDETVAKVELVVRNRVRASAWLLLGVAFGVGFLIAHQRSRA
ncbi:MAG: hypothetical protein Q8O67_15345 [Deltaproteobacteria bacterium]|nr:hypothetical protein [Deltaproteobacteria bacterium]